MALATALRVGDVNATQSLIAAGMTPDRDWLCETMRHGNVTLAEHLLENGVKQDIFTMAAMADLKALTHRLHRVGADASHRTSMKPSSHDVTPLHVACASDWGDHGVSRMRAQQQVAVLLRDYGADPATLAEYRGLPNVDPLLCACWTSQNAELVGWLLEQNVTPGNLHFLAALGHFQRHHRPSFDIAELLLDSGVGVDVANADGRTPLQTFAHQGNRAIVTWLIAKGANVTLADSHGRTAAHYAAERNTGPATLAVLVENGADLRAVDEDGRTPGDLAELNSKRRLIRWIADFYQE